MIIIILLIVIIIGLISYICYDKSILRNNTPNSLHNENNNTKSKKDNREEKIAFDDERFIHIYNKLKNYTANQNRIGYESFLDYELGEIALQNMKINPEDLTYLNDEKDGSKNYSINATKIIKSLETIFGKDAQITTNENLSGLWKDLGVDFPYGMDMKISSYDKENNNFIVKIENIGRGGTTGVSPTIKDRKIISATKKNDVITVVEKSIFIETENITDINEEPLVNKYSYRIYSVKGSPEMIDNKFIKETEIENTTISVEDYLEKAATITHTYKKNADTNQYYFIKSIIS